MSHLLIEIPKDTPSKGSWVHIVAENWIVEGILYLPDISYSPAYKHRLLVSGTEPDTHKWESILCYKVIQRFDSYDEARRNLPLAEKCLPLSTESSQLGRGFRMKMLKNTKLPGEESTTEPDSDVALNLPSTSRTQLMTRKKNPTIKSVSSPSLGKLPTPPPSLRNKEDINKSVRPSTNKNNVTTPTCSLNRGEEVKSNSDKVSKTKKTPTAAKHLSHENESRSVVVRNTDSSDEETPHPNNYFHDSSIDEQSQDLGQASSPVESYPQEDMGTTSTPYGGHENVFLSPFGNNSQHTQNLFLDRSDKSKQLSINSRTTHAVPGKYPQHLKNTAESYYHHYGQDMLSPSDVHRRPRNNEVHSTLVKIHDKLEVLEKAIKPVGSESEDDNINGQEDELSVLPLKNLAELNAFEKTLKRDKKTYNKLVLRIKRLGKRNTKNSESDYVKRAWNVVMADSLSKEVNWCGRKDKRVNNGMGKRGISGALITQAVEDGINANKKFKQMEKATFEGETKCHLRNAKSRHSTACSREEAERIEDNSD